MSNLNQVYDTVKCTKKLPFDINGITDALMADEIIPIRRIDVVNQFHLCCNFFPL